MLDVEFNLLKSVEKQIKSRARVRFHTGTAETPCNLVLLDRESLEPGQTAPVQIRLDTPVACLRNDRFVIRSYSPVRTLGGGRILNPAPLKHKRFKPETIDHFHILLTDDPETLISEHAKHAAFDEVSYSDLAVMTSLSGKPLDNALQSLMSKHILIQTDKDARRYIHQGTYEDFKSTTINRLKEFHSLNPLKNGMPKGELPSSFTGSFSAKLFNLMLAMLAKANEVILSENFIRLPGYQVTLEADQSNLKKKFSNAYMQAGLQPPSVKELIADLAVDAKETKNMLMLLVNEGTIVKVKDDLFFNSKMISSLKERLIDHLKSNGEINTPQFKDMTGVSRKYCIPLLEYFDAENITIRIGDIRKLRKQD
jgi:selenocysteine-specific elongation factor